MNLGDYAENYTKLNFTFTTRKDTGLPTVLAGSPVISVYKGSNVTPKTSAESYITLDIDYNSKVGLNHVLIDLSGDAFFVTGEDYHVVITTGTVDSISVIGETVATFSIENQADNPDTVGINSGQWYVSIFGNDSNSGRSWKNAKLTVGAANTAAAAGDIINIGPGNYNESIIIAVADLTIQGAGKHATRLHITTASTACITPLPR